MKNCTAIAIGVAVWFIASFPVLAGEAKRPLVNSDVTKLVKAKLSDSTIVINVDAIKPVAGASDGAVRFV